MHHFREKLALCRATSGVYVPAPRGGSAAVTPGASEGFRAPALAPHEPFPTVPAVPKANEATCCGAQMQTA